MMKLFIRQQLLKLYLIVLFGNLTTQPTWAQTSEPEKESHAVQQRRIKFSSSAQIWLRHTELNPGTTVNGVEQTTVNDVSIRRLRMAVSGHLSDRVFAKIQLGINNLNYLNLSPQIKLLDLEMFYKINDWLTLGGGKTGFTGLSRYASPGTASGLGVDIAVFNMVTVNLTDDLLRKMAVVAKGQIGGFDYRTVLAKPMTLSRVVPISENAEFSEEAISLQTSGYFKYQFFDRESQNTAYPASTYLGTKKLLNIGIGFMHQNDVTWSLTAAEDTVKHDMTHLAADLFLELPLNARGSKFITFYTGWFRYDFGPNYIRNIGVNNPSNGTDGSVFNGRGNSFPAIGTGQIWYSQLAYYMKIDKVFKEIEAIQPYVAMQDAHYDRLDEAMVLVDYGINILLKGQSSKFTLGFQHRPIYTQNLDSGLTVSDWKSMAVLQYQFKFKA